MYSLLHSKTPPILLFGILTVSVTTMTKTKHNCFALHSGRIILHNLKYDETIMEFHQDWGAVTSISFRTDGHPIMATGSVNGHILFWNLEERRVATQLMSAHDMKVTGMICLSNEPLVVTSSPDNTLKLWIFDMTDGGARLLRIREGKYLNFK